MYNLTIPCRCYYLNLNLHCLCTYFQSTAESFAAYLPHLYFVALISNCGAFIQHKYPDVYFGSLLRLVHDLVHLTWIWVCGNVYEGWDIWFTSVLKQSNPFDRPCLRPMRACCMSSPVWKCECVLCVHGHWRRTFYLFWCAPSFLLIDKHIHASA